MFTEAQTVPNRHTNPNSGWLFFDVDARRSMMEENQHLFDCGIEACRWRTNRISDRDRGTSSWHSRAWTMAAPMYFKVIEILPN
jgi:hypothetical protein